MNWQERGGSVHLIWSQATIKSKCYQKTRRSQHLSHPMGSSSTDACLLVSVMLPLHSRVIDDLTQVLNMEDLVTYLDDIICFHKTFPEHLAGIQRVLEMCRNAGLKLAPHECQLARKEISVLGHVVNREWLKPQQQKGDIIANWPQPNSKDELSRFLGLCGYYRRFISVFVLSVLQQ